MQYNFVYFCCRYDELTEESHKTAKAIVQTLSAVATKQDAAVTAFINHLLQCKHLLISFSYVIAWGCINSNYILIN
jgi:hypothetical protein